MTSTETATPTFSGLPINGSIVYGNERKAQRPVEEFSPLLQAALDAHGITEITWTQYTPYFNDGEPCVFGAYLRNVTVDSVIAEFPPYAERDRAALGYRQTANNGGRYEGPDAHRYDAIAALSSAIDNGEFDDVLLKLFGDHAEVNVKPGDGIYIEYYEHD